jgi:hypothetical protein
MGIGIQTHTLMAGIYEVCRLNALRYHDIYAEFHKDWRRHSKVGGGYIYRYTDSKMIS